MTRTPNHANPAGYPAVTPRSNMQRLLEYIPAPFRGAAAAGALALGVDQVDNPNAVAAMVVTFALGAVVEWLAHRRRVRDSIPAWPAVILLALPLVHCGAPILSAARVCVDDECVSAEILVHRGDVTVELVDDELLDVDVDGEVWVSHRGVVGYGWMRVRGGEATAGACGVVPYLLARCVGDADADADEPPH